MSIGMDLNPSLYHPLSHKSHIQKDRAANQKNKRVDRILHVFICDSSSTWCKFNVPVAPKWSMVPEKLPTCQHVPLKLDTCGYICPTNAACGACHQQIMRRKGQHRLSSQVWELPWINWAISPKEQKKPGNKETASLGFEALPWLPILDLASPKANWPHGQLQATPWAYRSGPVLLAPRLDFVLPGVTLRFVKSSGNRLMEPVLYLCVQCPVPRWVASCLLCPGPPGYLFLMGLLQGITKNRSIPTKPVGIT